MPWFDLPHDEPHAYRVTTAEPDGLDAWWRARVEDARRRARPVSLTRHHDDLCREPPVHDVRFTGADGAPVHAWYLLPPGSDPAPAEPLPVVLTFLGYGADRGLPIDTVAELPGAEPALIAVSGASQGGGRAPGPVAKAAPATRRPAGPLAAPSRSRAQRGPGPRVSGRRAVPLRLPARPQALPRPHTGNPHDPQHEPRTTNQGTRSTA